MQFGGHIAVAGVIRSTAVRQIHVQLQGFISMTTAAAATSEGATAAGNILVAAVVDVQWVQ